MFYFGFSLGFLGFGLSDSWVFGFISFLPSFLLLASLSFVLIGPWSAGEAEASGEVGKSIRERRPPLLGLFFLFLLLAWLSVYKTKDSVRKTIDKEERASTHTIAYFTST